MAHFVAAYLNAEIILVVLLLLLIWLYVGSQKWYRQHSGGDSVAYDIGSPSPPISWDFGFFITKVALDV